VCGLGLTWWPDRTRPTTASSGHFTDLSSEIESGLITCTDIENDYSSRIVVSDGGGNLKWLERDGFTEARRWNIAHGSIEAPRGIFGTLGDSYMDSGSGDIVIKIANIHDG